MKPASSTSHGRVEWLDSVRGLAALTVLFGHTVGILQIPPWFERLINVPIVSTIVDGRTAVTMFFLLSGFVLALPYARPRGDGGFRKVELASFYLRRFTRIWLPWFAVFCLSALAMVTVFGDYKTNPNPSPWAMQFWQEPLTIGQMARQLIFSLHNPVKVLVPQDWSLGVELKASLLLPLLIWLLRKSPWALTAFGFALLLLYPTGYYYFTF